MTYAAYIKFDTGHQVRVFPTSRKTSFFRTIEAAARRLEQKTRGFSYDTRGLVYDRGGNLAHTVAL